MRDRPSVNPAARPARKVSIAERLESALPLFVAAGIAAVLSFLLFGSTAHIANSHYPLWGLAAAIGAVTAVGGMVAVYAAGTPEGPGFSSAVDGTSVVVPIGEWREIQRQLHRQLERYEAPRENGPVPGGAAAAVARAAPSLTRDSMYVPPPRTSRPAAAPRPARTLPTSAPPEVSISLSSVPKEWEEPARNSMDTTQLASDLDRLISQIQRSHEAREEPPEPTPPPAPPAPRSLDPLDIDRTGKRLVGVARPPEPRRSSPPSPPDSAGGILPPKGEVELPKEFVEFVQQWYSEQESRKRQNQRPTKARADLAAAQALCVSCDRPLVGGRSALDCLSCGGGMCADCARIASAPLHGRRCPDCVATGPDWDEASDR